MPIGEDFLAPQLQMQQLANARTQQQAQQLAVFQRAKEMQDAQQMQGVLSTLGSMEGTPAAMLEKAGSVALKRGMLDQAEKAFAQAGMYQQRAAHAAQYQAEADQKKYNETQKRISGLVNYLGMFDDSEAGWQAAKTAYIAQHPQLTEDEIGVLQIPWAPGRRDTIRRGLMSVKDQLEMEQKAKAEGLKELELKGKEAHWERMDENARVRAEAYERQQARKDKVGGKGPHAAARPTVLDRQDAEGLIKDFMAQENIDDLPGSAITQLSLEIASRARSLAQEGTQWDEALEQAFEENKLRIKATDAPWYKPWAGKTGSVAPKREASGIIKPKAESSKTPAAPSKPEGYDELPVGATYEWNGKMYRKGGSE